MTTIENVPLFDTAPLERQPTGSFTAAERAVRAHLSKLSGTDLIRAVNDIRRVVSDYSPFRTEPTDFVEWVPAEDVHSNDYNPNSVAPPEMELLRLSINADGYTQPIVTMRDEDGARTVIDGFHRNRVGKEVPEVRARVHGHLPVVQIRSRGPGRPGWSRSRGRSRGRSWPNSKRLSRSGRLMPEWTCLVCGPPAVILYAKRASSTAARRHARAETRNVADAQQALASALADRGP